MLASAVLLAAGMSTRFPGNKLLKKVSVRGEAKPLIKYLVEKFVGSGVFNEVVVVVGHKKCSIMDAVGDERVKFVYNKEYRRGMSYSVVKGVEAVMGYADFVAIHPGDVPFVRVETLRLLVKEAVSLHKQGRQFILVPTYDSRRGHPVIVSRGLLPRAAGISEKKEGLRSFINENRGRLYAYPVDDRGILVDIDTPEDLMNNIGLLSD